MQRPRRLWPLLIAVDDDADLSALAQSYGVRRSSAKFRATSDWMNASFARGEPVAAGLFDLNRYGNY